MKREPWKIQPRGNDPTNKPVNVWPIRSHSRSNRLPFPNTAKPKNPRFSNQFQPIPANSNLENMLFISATLLPLFPPLKFPKFVLIRAYSWFKLRKKIAKRTHFASVSSQFPKINPSCQIVPDRGGWSGTTEHFAGLPSMFGVGCWVFPRAKGPPVPPLVHAK